MTEHRATSGLFVPECFATMTRASGTSQYTAGDIVANSTSAAEVVPLKFPACRTPNGSGLITGGRMIKSDDDVTQASFRLWLLTKQPFATGSYPADNAALVLTYAALGYLIGYMDFSTFVDAGSAGSGNASMSAAAHREMPFNCARAARMPTDDSVIVGGQFYDGTRLIYGVLEAVGTYTPASAEQFTVWLDVQQN